MVDVRVEPGALVFYASYARSSALGETMVAGTAIRHGKCPVRRGVQSSSRYYCGLILYFSLFSLMMYRAMVIFG